MKSSRLLDDVNLSEIIIRRDASAIEFLFLNMRDGGDIASLLCTGILVFSYHIDPDDALPLYVGEVNHALVPGDEVAGVLRKLNYYRDVDDSGIPGGGQIHYVNMAGGEWIEVVCTGVKLQLAEGGGGARRG